MIDDDQLDVAMSRALQDFADRDAPRHASLVPRILRSLHNPRRKRLFSRRRLWLVPMVFGALALSTGSALALYSHTAPILWIYSHPAAGKAGASATGPARIPVPISIGAGSALLGAPLQVPRGLGHIGLVSSVYRPALSIDGRAVPGSLASVELTYAIDGTPVALNESYVGPGTLVTKLKSGPPAFGRQDAIIYLDGGTYELERDRSGQVMFVEWKSRSGVVVTLTGADGQGLATSFVEMILTHIQ